jgi:PD-(D/E)XK endonuclease
MEHPKDVGDKSTLAIMLALRERGYWVLVPFGENTRYDLVIDDGCALQRVQCKTAGYGAEPSYGTCAATTDTTPIQRK